jgi:hypothetical protein
MKPRTQQIEAYQRMMRAAAEGIEECQRQETAEADTGRARHVTD